MECIVFYMILRKAEIKIINRFKAEGKRKAVEVLGRYTTKKVEGKGWEGRRNSRA